MERNVESEDDGSEEFDRESVIDALNEIDTVYQTQTLHMRHESST